MNEESSPPTVVEPTAERSEVSTTAEYHAMTDNNGDDETNGMHHPITASMMTKNNETKSAQEGDPSHSAATTSVSAAFALPNTTTTTNATVSAVEMDKFADEESSFFHDDNDNNTTTLTRRQQIVIASAVLVLVAMLVGISMGVARHGNNNHNSDYAVMDGRPFRESLDAAPIFASIIPPHECLQDVDCRAWTMSTATALFAESSSSMAAAAAAAAAETRERLELDAEDEDVAAAQQRTTNTQSWMQRALGEHASIASFAVFSVALLTHQAPPDLIQQALEAAQDELRHARLAFGRTGQTMGPSALPPSRLDLTHDFTTLGLAVAQEGCIDETLSAMELAYDAAVTATMSTSDEDLLQSIALDEARHAGLAWRTVQWVCRKDTAACEIVLETVLNEKNLARAISTRFGGKTASLGVNYNMQQHDIQETCQRLFQFLMAWLVEQQQLQLLRTENKASKVCVTQLATTEQDDPANRIARAIQHDICQHEKPVETG